MAPSTPYVRPDRSTVAEGPLYSPAREVERCNVSDRSVCFQPVLRAELHLRLHDARNPRFGIGGLPYDAADATASHNVCEVRATPHLKSVSQTTRGVATTLSHALPLG